MEIRPRSDICCGFGCELRKADAQAQSRRRFLSEQPQADILTYRKIQDGVGFLMMRLRLREIRKGQKTVRTLNLSVIFVAFLIRLMIDMLVIARSADAGSC